MDVMNHEGSSTTSFCKVEAVHMYYTLISMNLFTQDEFDVMKVRDGYNIRHYDHYMRIPCDEAGRRIFTPQILFD